MPHDQLLHPEAEKLQAFALGKVTADEVDAIQDHLRECPSCCEFLDGVGDDTFVGLLREVETVVGRDAHVRDPSKTDGQPTIPSAAEAATLPPSVIGDTNAEAGSRTALTTGPGERLSVPELADHPRFQVLEMIGQGGMGAVYKAEHRHMKRQVALKVINPKLVSGKGAVDRFRREVEAAARLHHPNIVTAYDAELAGDVHFLVMEYVQGTDLHEVLQCRGPLPVDEACDYIRQAAVGLQHAHENGMVHRDIKPHNLMLTPEGRVKILDFGLASLAAEAVTDEIGDVEQTDGGTEHLRSSLTQAGSIMGTPDYMAPEQARDAHAADIRADIYSLGCTLYALLTGKAPFSSGTTIDKIIAHAEHAPRPVSRDDVPKKLRDVLAKMLAKDPADRFQTPAEVATALVPFTHADVRPDEKARRAVTAPADGLIVAASIAFLTAIGCLLYWRLAAGALTVPHPWDTALQFCSLANLLYATLLLAAGQMLHRRRARTAVMVSVAVVGVVLPAVYAVNYLMERLGFWPLMIPQWLGVPICIWAVVALFRQDVRDAFAETEAGSRFGRRELAGVLGVPAAAVLLGGVIWVATDTGQIKIDSKVDDVQVIVTQGGKQVEVIDLKTGTSVKRLPSGDYQIAVKGNRSDVKLSKGTLTISRWGKAVVTLTAVPTGRAKMVVEAAVDRTDFARVVAAGRGKLSQREKQQLLAENHPLLGQLADPNTKPIIELFANLPDTAHRQLLRDGYLKWNYSSLDAARQKAYDDILKMYFDQAKKQGITPPATMSREAFKKSGVGFAVVRIPELKTAVVSWYILLPEHPAPMWVTVVGVHATGKQPYFDAHYKQLAALRLKNYSRPIPSAKPLPRTAADLPKFWVGHWKSESRIVVPKLPPAQANGRGILRMSLVADGRYLRGVNTSDSGRFQTLNVQTYDARKGRLLSWFFMPDGKGSGEPGPGIWDAETRTIVFTKRLPDGIQAVHQFEIVDANTVKSRSFRQNAKDEIVADVRFTWARLSAPVATKPVPIDPTRPEQMKVLDRLVGEWHNEVTAKQDGKTNVDTARSAMRHILAGRMVEGFDAVETANRNDYWLTWFDPRRKQYRVWFFSGDGPATEFTGVWDASTSTMSLTSTDKLIEGRWIFKNKDLREFPITIKDKTGNVQTQIDGISRRLPDLDALQKLAEAWLKLMDDGKYGEAWEQSAAPNKKGISKADMVKLYTKTFQKYGKVTSRKFFSRDYVTELPGFPKGRYVLIKYLTDFGNQKDLVQNVLLIPDNGGWKVQAHILVPKDPFAKPQKVGPTAREEDRLQGTWRPERYEQDGQPMPPEILKKMQFPTQFIFQGNHWVAVRPDLKKFESTFTLDAGKQPKWMDVSGSLIEGMPNIHGIYKLEGDILTLCASEKGKPRPTDFVTKGKRGYLLIVARRVPAVPERLQGKWVPVSGHFRAKPLTNEQLARLSITFDGHRVELVDFEGKRQTGTFEIDARRKPMFIDVTAPDRKEKSPGIFEFDGDRLKLAFIDGDYARPTDFAPSNRPDHMTLTMKRVPATGSLFAPDELKVLKEAESFLAVFDTGRFGQLHGMLAGYAKQNVTRDQFSQAMQKVWDTVGKVKQRNIRRVKLLSSFPGLPKGRYAIVQYQSDFERKQGTWESLLLNVDPDGQWRVNTYANTVKPLPIPGEKKKPVQSVPPPLRKKAS